MDLRLGFAGSGFRVQAARHHRNNILYLPILATSAQADERHEGLLMLMPNKINHLPSSGLFLVRLSSKL